MFGALMTFLLDTHEVCSRGRKGWTPLYYLGFTSLRGFYRLRVLGVGFRGRWGLEFRRQSLHGFGTRSYRI